LRCCRWPRNTSVSLIVEPAVADSITGENWNRYIFRTSRNSSQDAISNAVALGGEGVTIATLAQDYAFGRDGVAAFREALEATGAEIAVEEYVPTDTTDFTAAAERIFQAMSGVEGRRSCSSSGPAAATRWARSTRWTRAGSTSRSRPAATSWPRCRL
jgi:hypothetical protein